MKTSHLILFAFLSICSVYLYQKTENPLKKHIEERNTNEPSTTINNNFKCDGRTHCSQMTSCSEAKFFLNNCPNVKMDGNGDGVPCERQWCSKDESFETPSKKKPHKMIEWSE